MNRTRLYNPSEFSPIYPPDVKPEKIGWYFGNDEDHFPGDIAKLHSQSHYLDENNYDTFYWDGEWRDAPGQPAIETSQNKHWFGLNYEGA